MVVVFIFTPPYSPSEESLTLEYPELF